MKSWDALLTLLLIASAFSLPLGEHFEQAPLQGSTEPSGDFPPSGGALSGIYDVIFDSPSGVDWPGNGSMPVGNGDMAANVPDPFFQ